MRFRLRDLLFLNVVVAISLAAILSSMKNASIPSEYLVINTISLVSIGIAVIYGVSLWVRRKKIRDIKPVFVIIYACVHWQGLLIAAVLILLMSLTAFQQVHILVCSGVGTLLGYSLISITQTAVLISEKGLVYQQGLIPWNRVALVRDLSGQLLKLQLPKEWRKFPISVPADQRQIIEDLLSKIQNLTAEVF